YDLHRNSKTPFTFDRSPDAAAVWSPNGRAIVFSARRNARGDLYLKPSNGDGGDHLLYADNWDKTPTSWSPDGKFLLFDGLHNHIFLLSDPAGSGEHKAVPFMQTQSREQNGQFSPDGRWVAYESWESGQEEIYIAPFPGPGAKHQVSTSG